MILLLPKLSNPRIISPLYPGVAYSDTTTPNKVPAEGATGAPIKAEQKWFIAAYREGFRHGRRAPAWRSCAPARNQQPGTRSLKPEAWNPIPRTLGQLRHNSSATSSLISEARNQGEPPPSLVLDIPRPFAILSPYGRRDPLSGDAARGTAFGSGSWLSTDREPPKY